MNPSAMSKMTDAEIDAYAKMCGIELDKDMTKAAKVELIAKRHERVATVTVFGLEVEIPVKKMHDKRIVDRISRISTLTDDETVELFTDMVGEDGFNRIIGVCTDEDGTVDVEAVGLAFSLIAYSDELKNF